MAKTEKRFVVRSAGNESMVQGAQIWIDKQTGVNYLFVQSGYAGGLTPLLDREGNPILSPLPVEE